MHDAHFKLKKVVVSCTLAFAASVASAGFGIVDESAAPQVVPAAAKAKAASQTQASAPVSGEIKSAAGFGLVAVEFLNEAPADIEFRRGFGRDIPLVEALKQIAPQGWHAFLKEELLGDGKFDRTRVVSWKGGRRWTDVLDILANDQGLFIDVDWAKKQLYVGAKKIAPPAPVSTESAAAVASAPAAEKWNIHAGDKISDVFETWCKSVGWKLVWEARPIAAEVDVAIDGQFDTVVETIVDALNRGGAGIRAIFYDANQVLRIVEKNAEKKQ